ncbi:hypothetical protein N6H14_30445 [Paenibacillus sp. CC-CFT747]|nr:hypothetical protein N6H14_30445 [Paenibacillus sp. CC-CFT747]
MNLADMLSYADIKELSRIARNYDCACNLNSKHELIQSILIQVNRSDRFQQEVGSLEVEEIRFLNSLLFDARDTFSLEELTARVRLTKFVKEEKDTINPREIIARFKQRGWLFNGHSQQTRYLFQFPADLKRRFCETLSKQFQHQLVGFKETPSVYREEQRMLEEDLYRFLEFVAPQPVALNAEGYLYKRTLQQILEGFSVQEEPVPKAAWRFGYGRRFKEYPSRFSFLYDYCYYNELVLEEGTLLSLTDKGRKRIEEGTLEDPRQVYRFWLRLYKGPVPNLQSLAQWMDLLARQWVTTETLSRALTPLIKPFYYDSPESIMEQRVIRMMMHLGLLKLGEHDRWGTAVQITSSGSKIIQGTYVPEDDGIVISV